MAPGIAEALRALQAVTDVSPRDVAAIFGELERIRAVLWAKMLMPGGSPEREAAEIGPALPTDEWISLDKAAALVGRPKVWLLRKSPRPAWVKRLGRKTFVVNKPGLLRWLDSRPS